MNVMIMGNDEMIMKKMIMIIIVMIVMIVMMIW